MPDSRIRSRIDSRIALSGREVELLQLLELGLTTKEAARRLGISYHTAVHHLRQAMARLGTHGRVESLASARAHGFLPPPRSRLRGALNPKSPEALHPS